VNERAEFTYAPPDDAVSVTPGAVLAAKR